MFCFLLSLIAVIFLIPDFGQASIQFEFQGEGSQACKEKVQTWMDEVNKELPSHWVPTEFIVAHSEAIEDDSYKPILHTNNFDTFEVFEKIIVLAKGCSQTHFIHEYGHLVLDHLMRTTSPSWQYFITWALFTRDLDEEQARLLNEIEVMEETRAEYKIRILERSKSTDKSDEEPENLAKFLKEAVKNLTKKLKENRDGLDRIDRAKKGLGNKDSGSLEQFKEVNQKSHTALESFSELFSDSLAAIMMNDWSVVKKAFTSDLEASKTLYSSHFSDLFVSSEEADSAYISCRDFRSGLSIESYSYAPWESASLYCEFTPVRSLIRNYMENNPTLTPKDMIQALGLAIIDVYENELMPYPENINRSLSEKNQSLSQSLRNQLSL